MPRTFKIRGAVALVAVSAVAGGGGYAIAGGPDKEFDAPPASPDQVASSLTQFSGLQRGTARPEDKAFAESFAARSKIAVDPTTIRLVATSRGSELYALSGPESVCVLRKPIGEDRGKGGACSDPTITADGAHPLVSIDVIDGGYAVAGLFPDGIESASLELKGGRAVPVTVSSNAFITEVSETPVGLSWARGDEGSSSISFDHLDD